MPAVAGGHLDFSLSISMAYSEAKPERFAEFILCLVSVV